MYTTSLWGDEDSLLLLLLLLWRDPEVVVAALDMVGGVWWPPVNMLEELDSSPSLSYKCDGDLSPRVPFIFWDRQNCGKGEERNRLVLNSTKVEIAGNL